MKHTVKVTIASILSILIIGYGTLLIKKSTNKYNEIIKKANTELNIGNYNEAKALYNESLNLKKNKNILSKINYIDNIILAKAKIDEANSLYINGKFNSALEILNKIDLDNLNNTTKEKIVSLKQSLDTSLKSTLS